MMSIGESAEVKAMLTRLIDFLKNQGITSLFTSLTGAATTRTRARSASPR